MNRRRIALWLRVSIALLVLTGSLLALRQYRKTRPAADLPTAVAKKGDFLVLVRCRGMLSAHRSVQLTAPLDVPDLQIVWLAPPGSDVKAGETVIKFDPSRTQQDLKEKTAALHQAQSSLEQAVAQARNTTEQDKLDLATARYQMERARLEVSKQSIVSAIQGQESAIDFGLTEEKVKVQDSAGSLHEASSTAKIASLTRLCDQAQSQVDLTQHRLALMELKSPLTGVINYLQNNSQGWMNAQPFKTGDHATPGSALAEIPDLTTLQMESKVEEVDRGRIALGDAVMVHVDAFPEKTIDAKLTAIAPLTEQDFVDWPPTRSFKSYAELSQSDPRLRPSMNASADVVQTKIKDAVSIPAKALFTIGGKPSVYVKRAGQYVAVEVRVKARNPDEIAVEGIGPSTLVALAEPLQEKQ